MQWLRFNGYCILDIECFLYYMYCITYSISAWYYRHQQSCFTVRPTLLTMVAGGNIEMESPFYIYSYAHVLWMQGVTWIISTLLKFSLGGNSGSAICEDINISFQRLWYIGFFFLQGHRAGSWGKSTSQCTRSRVRSVSECRAWSCAYWARDFDKMRFGNHSKSVIVGRFWAVALWACQSIETSKGF